MTATQWGEVLISFSVQVMVVMIAGKFLERGACRSADRCLIWSSCFAGVLFLACTAVMLPRLHVIQPWSMLQPRTLVTVSEAQAILGRLLVAMWCIGATVSLVRWLARGFLLRRFLRRCERMPSKRAQRIFGAVRREPGFKQLPTVFISDEAEGPFCCQLHQPVIVLPRFLLEGNPEDLCHVLTHEMEHLATNHPLQLFVQQLVQVLCWFHPAVWRAAWQASLSREFVCDDAAASQGADCAAYLRTLLHIAERCEQKNKGLAIGFSKTASEIVIRAHRLVTLAKSTSINRSSPAINRKWIISVMILITCAMTQVWLPFDPLNSTRSRWSPWPTWTAKSMHCFNVCLRDYELFDRRVQVHELVHEINQDDVDADLIHR